MALPTISDLVTYVSKGLSGADWNSNWQKIVNWLSNGKTDIKVKNIEIASTGGITNNGTMTQNGNMSVTGNITANGNVSATTFYGDGSNLTNITSANAIVYTPFCVNNGNVDSSGNGDLLIYTANTSSNVKIQFKVGGNYSNFIATTAKGYTKNETSLYELDMANYTTDGTYIIYIAKGSIQPTVTAVSAVLYRQPNRPAQGLAKNGDIWLDTSREQLVSYLHNGSTFVEQEIIPIGTVTMGHIDSELVITSATTYNYNVNGYNVIINGKYSTSNQKPVVIVNYNQTINSDTTSTYYRIYSDGWVEQGGTVKGGNQTITLPIPMQDTNYYGFVCYQSNYNSGDTDYQVSVRRTSTTQIYLDIGRANGNTFTVWKVTGFKGE